MPRLCSLGVTFSKERMEARVWIQTNPRVWSIIPLILRLHWIAMSMDDPRTRSYSEIKRPTFRWILREAKKEVM